MVVIYERKSKMKRLLRQKQITRIIVLALMLTMLAWLAPMNVEGANAATGDTKIPVTGGYLLFDKATGTITGHEGNITDVIIPTSYEGVSIRKIGKCAFSRCRSLTSLWLPNGIYSIGREAFYGCDGLTNITIPERVDYIDAWTFAGCSGLTSVSIPDRVENIGEQAFYGCSGLTSIVIPDRVIDIGFEAFAACDGLRNVTIPAGVNRVEASFTHCNNLTSIIVDIDNPFYASQQGVLFDKEKTQLIQYPAGIKATHYEIPDGVTEIKCSAFAECNNLSGITIPDSVTAIDIYAFLDCENLINVTIPNSVTTIAPFAFLNCRSLTCIIIPDSVLRPIVNEAFGYQYDKDGKKVIKIEGFKIYGYSNDSAAAKYARDNEFSYTILDEESQLVPISGGYLIFGNETESITGCVGNFSNEKWLDIVMPEIIPNGEAITSISERAFENCDMRSVTIPDTMEYINRRAFYNCRNLDVVTIPDSVVSIGKQAFGYQYDKDEKKVIKIEGFKIYGYSNDSAAAKYADHDGFEYIAIGNNNSGNKNDSEQNNNQEGNGQDNKKGNTSNNDKSQSNVSDNDLVTTIKDATDASIQMKTGNTEKDKSGTDFYIVTQASKSGGTVTYKKPVDKKKTSVTIPTTVKIEGKSYKVTAIEKNAFKGNKKLKSVKIGSNIEKIGANAFNKCVNLKKVTIPSKVKAIQKGAFANCKNLKSITIQTKKLTKKTVGAKAFKGTHPKATVKAPKGKAKAYKTLLRSKGLSKKAEVK